jgi:CRP/FNR family transcriptional regulator, nitrogen fixation regulation protein
MADTKGRLSGILPRRDQVFEAVSASKRLSRVFVDQRSVQRALSALQRGPIHFHRNNVIACEGEAADYIFLVVSGVVRSCRTFQNGTRNVVAFYLPGDLFGWSDQNYSLSVEAATDAMVLFLKRSALMSVAARESRVASFLLDIATNELHRAQERAVLMGRSAKSRVATFLTDLSRKLGTPNSLDLSMSHQDIAEHLGLTVETLSRTITGLERSGLVSRVGTRTLILRNDRLLSQVSE